ncbi:MAG TPA: cytochrome c [Verrucomicrobiae bacterium]|nr:cytochrome c [Verrucomicrobiae bacterium]
MRSKFQAAITVLGLALGFVISPSLSSASKTECRSPEPQAPGTEQKPGRDLYEKNCSHCHGEDARGDEGPSLHNLELSDGGIARRIRDGIKGEMPRFASKLSEADIGAIIGYLRTLRE